MSADLHIHVLEGCTEEDISKFNSHTLGSKHFNLGAPNPDFGEGSPWKRVADSPNIWVGEVSWLKAALFEDGEAFVPNTVMAISALIGEELPVIDDELIAGIAAAFTAVNTTSYGLAKPEDVLSFLEKHRGKPAFTVSW